MGLRETAEEDNKKILEDSLGFGFEIKVTNPAGTSADLVGFSNDVSDLIDPETGQAVSGRQASVALNISSLTAAGLDLPKAIADKTLKPWLVEFDDINGNSFTFKVIKSNPDRGIGMVTCMLEIYENAA